MPIGRDEPGVKTDATTDQRCTLSLTWGLGLPEQL
jgi:hypothetical protein